MKAAHPTYVEMGPGVRNVLAWHIKGVPRIVSPRRARKLRKRGVFLVGCDEARNGRGRMRYMWWTEP